MTGPYTLSAIDMLDFFERQREWSYETFGPPSHRGPLGPLDHLAKEVKEAVDEATKLNTKSKDVADAQSPQEALRDLEHLREEIIDCLFLVFDAAHRSGMTYADMSRIAMMKLDKNRRRVWPDWRTADPSAAVEHDRSGEPNR